jgi:hypothetical protein
MYTIFKCPRVVRSVSVEYLQPFTFNMVGMSIANEGFLDYVMFRNVAVLARDGWYANIP